MSNRIPKRENLPTHYHDYDKDPFCVTEYRDRKRPDLKWMVRSKLSGKWQRKFFKREREAKTHVELKRIELLNQGKEGVTFSTALRVIAQRANERLEHTERQSLMRRTST